MKLETWLRMAGIPYEVAPPDFSQAPKGKIPYVEIDGVLMGDSTLVMEHLAATRGLDTDRGLGPADRAVSLAFRRMVKEALYWVMMYDRWVSDCNFAIFEPLFLRLYVQELPLGEQKAVVASVRERVKAQCHAQGMGRHAQAEVHWFGMADLRALSDFLGNKPFLMGEAPTTADAAVYAHLANVVEVPLASPVKDYGRRLPNLIAYCKLRSLAEGINMSRTGPPW